MPTNEDIKQLQKSTDHIFKEMVDTLEEDPDADKILMEAILFSLKLPGEVGMLLAFAVNQTKAELERRRAQPELYPGGNN